jgi:hypothetical protein
MPPDRRRRDPRVERVFHEFAGEYIAEWDRLDTKLVARRDNLIRRVHKAGPSHDEIADALQLSRQRVSRIILPR